MGRIGVGGKGDQARQTGRGREQTCAHSEGRGEGGTKWEIGMDIYTLPFSNSHAWVRELEHKEG